MWVLPLLVLRALYRRVQELRNGERVRSLSTRHVVAALGDEADEEANDQ